MCRLQPAAHFVRGNTTDLWTTAGDCPDANQEREPIQRRTIRSDICILSICTPWKSANTYPPSLSFPLILCPPPPPDEGSTPWPQGQPLSLRPTRLPLLLLVYPSDPVRPGYNTWPRPRDGPIGVQGKCPFLYVCLQAALSSPCPIFTCTAPFFMLSHKKLRKKTSAILFGRPNFALKIKVFLSLGLFHCIHNLTAFIQRSLTFSLLFPLLLLFIRLCFFSPSKKKGSMSKSYHTHSKVMMW